MAIKSEPLGLCNFCNFLFSMRLSNGEYFKNFKFLTRHGFYEFAWNDFNILIWQTYEHGCGYIIDNFKHLNGK